ATCINSHKMRRIPRACGRALRGGNDTMPSVALPGVSLWDNDTSGTGTPVIFLHAASGTSESWVYQLPVFTAAGYRCITYDRRGWGRSQPAPTGETTGHASDDTP